MAMPNQSLSNDLMWKQVNQDGFGDVNNWAIWSGMTAFNDALYVGTENDYSGAEVWRSQDGITWSQVNQDGFGNVRNADVSSMAVFKGYLYAGTLNEYGGEI